MMVILDWSKELSARFLRITAGPMKKTPGIGCTVLLAWAVILMAASSLVAQPVAVPEGAVEGAPQVRVQPTPPGAAVPGAPQQPPGRPGGKPGEGPKPPEGAPKPPGDAKPESPKVVSRPAKPSTPPNPAELKIRPNAAGKVRFNFQGQPWLGVLEWLAEISGLSLDWQELPSDFLNLRTQHEYSLDEARDLINRHLLDRGFTMLRNGEVLTVVNIKKLDPALVPRVDPEELEIRDSHEFVKVSFPLKWLIAEKAVEEFKPMLSPNHKITALKSTNRIEAMDAVANLREVYAVLNQEQSLQGQEQLVREFKLLHTRAPDVQKLLEALLGMESSAAPAAGSRGMSPQQMQQMQMQQMQMAQQAQQQGGKPAALPKQEPKIHLVVNLRENSILANAAPDQMAVIEQAIKTLDVPSGGEQSLLKILNRVHVYRLAAIDPESLVKMLEELGDLDPTTRLQVDKSNRSIIAHASLVDHVTIRTLVQKLDGTDRRFEVVKLRRLEADYVAGTIEFMMGGGEKKQQNQRYNPFYIDYGYMYGGRSRGGEEEDSRRFRVDADVENNRLLLWANEVEMEEVRNLLVKLGEIPQAGAIPDTVRVLDSLSPEEADELMERLFRAWPSVAPNPLRRAPLPGDRGAETRNAPPEELAPQRTPASSRDKTTERVRPSHPLDASLPPASLLVALSEEDELNDDEELNDDKTDVPAVPLRGAAGAPGAAAESGSGRLSSEQPSSQLPRRRPDAPPPVTIGRTAYGRIVISSDDPEALDRLEDLADQLAPPRRDYKVFHLKNKSTWAYGVALNLKDFFEEKEKKGGSNWNPYYGFVPGGGSSGEESARRLSKRKPMKFIADSDSHTILVVGADPAQLKTIQELIDLYDVPDTAEGKAIRQTKVVSIRFSKARIIADAVKEVYRDLLSANDPALQQNQQGKDKERPPERSYTYIYGSSGTDEEKPETPVKFKGLLSIGVDDLSNTLIISAAEGLMETVSETVQSLDMAARPTVNTLQVMKVSRDIDLATLQQRLQKVAKQPTPPPDQRKQQQPGQPQRGPQQPQQPVESGGDSITVIENY
jgi:type II secretory pathway component GspD/PulD (secretin)